MAIPSQTRLPFAALTIALVLAASTAHPKQPAYAIAPGTPVCTTDQTGLVVCSWSTDGLDPAPLNWAAEAIASYDPDCNGTPDLSRTFKLSTRDANPVIDIPRAALDVTVCTSGDNPCTTTAVYHAKSVQVRVKAGKSSATGSNANLFSGLSEPLTIPGACLCPDMCVSIANRALAASYSHVQFFYCGTDSNGALLPSIVWDFDSNDPLPPDGVTNEYSGSMLQSGAIGCSEEGPAVRRQLNLTQAEGEACLAQFAPQFAAKFNFPCDPSAANPPKLINYTPP